MTNLLPVTVAVPVRNEARNLPSCLERLGRFGEVVVIDSGSTDDTVAIAERMGARVVRFEWNGRYPKKRNHLLLNETLAHPWVLFLDADEQVPDALYDELACVLPESDKAGYWIEYRNYFEGKELRYGIAQRKLALIRVGRGLYERIEEESWSRLDMEIHEHPVLDGPVGTIRTRIDHRDFRGLSSFLARHIDYAQWETRRVEMLRAQGIDRVPHLTSRQRFKYRNIGHWWYPALYFAATYIVRCGFLDGRAGLDYAFYKYWYFSVIRSLIAERSRDVTAER